MWIVCDSHESQTLLSRKIKTTWKTKQKKQQQTNKQKKKKQQQQQQKTNKQKTRNVYKERGLFGWFGV